MVGTKDQFSVSGIYGDTHDDAVAISSEGTSSFIRDNGGFVHHGTIENVTVQIEDVKLVAGDGIRIQYISISDVVGGVFTGSQGVPNTGPTQGDLSFINISNDGRLGTKPAVNIRSQCTLINISSVTPKMRQF